MCCSNASARPRPNRGCWPCSAAARCFRVPRRRWGWPRATSAAWLLLAAGLSLAYLLGNVALQYGASRLAASTTSLVMLSEVLFASASSVLLGAAELPLRVWLGGALIVAAAAWQALTPGADADGSDH